MRLATLPFVLVFAALANATEDDADRTVLRHLKEELWPQAYRENDVDLLDRILDPTFVLIAADGSWSTRSDELRLLPERAWPHDSFRYSIRRLDIYGGSMAIVAGEGRATGNGRDGPCSLTYQSSNVLVRGDDGWRAVMSHVSGVETVCP